MSTLAVYQQVFDPVADSLFASAPFAMLPLLRSSSCSEACGGRRTGPR